MLKSDLSPTTIKSGANLAVAQGESMIPRKLIKSIKNIAYYPQYFRMASHSRRIPQESLDNPCDVGLSSATMCLLQPFKREFNAKDIDSCGSLQKCLSNEGHIMSAVS